jgi:hypothetical protein
MCNPVAASEDPVLPSKIRFPFQKLLHIDKMDCSSLLAAGPPDATRTASQHQPRLQQHWHGVDSFAFSAEIIDGRRNPERCGGIFLLDHFLTGGDGKHCEWQHETTTRKGR